LIGSLPAEQGSGPDRQPDREALAAGAVQLGLALTRPQTDALLAYLVLLQKWNKVYNLTAVRDLADMLTRHLLDSLAVVNPLRNRLAALAYEKDGVDEAQGGSSGGTPSGYLFRLLDVGSGAGLPGIVVAICCPHVAVDCVDTVAKKAAFISQVAAALRLPNLRGLHNRVENLAGPYDVVSARAFASLVDFTTLSAKALGEGGVWLAMKGKHPAEELAGLPKSVEVFHVEQLSVPGLDAERCIVWMRKAG
jgi:16S rRNA (guanine527-N7)-methyltransferase